MEQYGLWTSSGSYRYGGHGPWSRRTGYRGFWHWLGSFMFRPSNENIKSDTTGGASNLVEESYELRPGSRSFRPGRPGSWVNVTWYLQVERWLVGMFLGSNLVFSNNELYLRESLKLMLLHIGIYNSVPRPGSTFNWLHDLGWYLISSIPWVGSKPKAPLPWVGTYNLLNQVEKLYLDPNLWPPLPVENWSKPRVLNLKREGFLRPSRSSAPCERIEVNFESGILLDEAYRLKSTRSQVLRDAVKIGWLSQRTMSLECQWVLWRYVDRHETSERKNDPVERRVKASRRKTVLQGQKGDSKETKTSYRNPPCKA